MALFTIGAVLIFAGVVCLIEIPKLVQKGWFRELWVFSILLGLGVVLVMVNSLGVAIPGLEDMFVWLFKPLVKMFQGLKK